MAQAFEIPKGVTGAHPGPLATGSRVNRREVPSNAFPDRRSRSDP